MLSGARVRLWPLERQDLARNYQWANDPELVRLAGIHPSPKSSWEIERWFESVTSDPTVTTFSVKTAEGEHLGNIELRGLDLRCGSAEVGVLLGARDTWSQGYGTEAVRALCQYAFAELRLHRLFARVLESNPRALALFEKCGFQREGRERQGHFQGGRFWDVHLLGLLAPEWAALGGPPDPP